MPQPLQTEPTPGNGNGHPPIPPGYRLQYLELYNWGTFDGQIYTIRPEGESSLLTGANGSGKTTLIDAMLTLLVPERKHRFYNQSSGAEKKTERSEESYVLGQYGNIQEEGRSYSTAQQLRTDKRHAYSILLASFCNHAGQSVTLAQCRWFVNQELKRAWVIGYAPLTIASDFTPFDPKGQWKRDLRSKYPPQDVREVVEFFDSASKYARRMLRVFGMRSPKALTLFNQTVGIKVLGNLDAFIRDNMLEAGDSEEAFVNLKDTYRLLLNAKNAMDKAEKQIELLKPVVDLAETLGVLEQAQGTWRRDLQLSELYFANRRQAALEQQMARSREELKGVREEIDKLNEALERCRDDKESLARAMQSDQTGQELAQLGQQVKQLEFLQRQKQEELTRYNLLAQALGFAENPDEAGFKKSLKLCQQRTTEIQDQRRKLAQDGFAVQRELEQHLQGVKLKESEIKQLSQQKNNITGRVAEIRAEIAAHLNISPAELPFVAELLQVKQEAGDWEMVIEKLLRGFAMRLIVPERFYSEVNAYVNRVNLRGRLVYHKVPDYYLSENKIFAPPKALVHKLLFHPESPYSAWVKEQILTNYDFLCADNLGEFETYRKAVTREGLIKAASRHEKDDQQGMGRSQFVLGWTNTGKVDFMVQEIHRLQDQVERCLKEQDRLQREQEKQDWQLKNIAKFEELTDFDNVHWEAVADRLEELYQQQLNLQNSSGGLHSLKEQIDGYTARIKTLEDERVVQIRREQELATGIDDYRNQLEDAKGLIKHARLDGVDVPAAELPALYADFEARFKEQLAELRLENVSLLARALKEEIERRLGEFRQRLETTRRQLERAMMTFKRPDKETLYRFPDWASDTYQLPEDIAYVDEYLAFYQRLAQDDLPSFTREFERYLTTHMIQKMADYRESFYQQEQEILLTIGELNVSLNQINFRSLPQTYIQLKAVRSSAPTVLRFRQLLDEWIPVSDEADGVYALDTLKQSFEAIRELIEKLEHEEHWKRQVTDVRNWNEYYAEEYYRETAKPMKVYRSMGELSGGEKAQLTYTILGSAIAYQFGITQAEEAHSFRFIAVDESFSNQDDEKATYLMDLCRQLHLQLLVVTPNDKTHIVEPYISSVHFVYRRNNRTSHLLDMPIVEFQHKRNEWQSLAEVMGKN
ncbi:MAG: ATP-binding protein [Candidatus Sericytochromatia bacterium]